MTHISGFFTYKGIMTQQCNNVGDVFRELFVTVKPKTIIEIGTSHGGLTLLIRDILDEENMSDVNLITYDKDKFHYLDYHIENGKKIDSRIKNLFNHMYNDLSEYDEINDLIKQDGVTIVLCDGGYKKSEFRLLSNLIKPGDIIMGHDYSPNQEYFDANVHGKIWNWLELTDNDINESCQNNGLEPFMAEEFKQVVWVCKIKK
jgi:predicted O-methyltransferase YrrM